MRSVISLSRWDFTDDSYNIITDAVTTFAEVVSSISHRAITKTRLCNIQRFVVIVGVLLFFFKRKKMKISSENCLLFFNIIAQNMDCVYTLEQPQQGGSYECTLFLFLLKNKKQRIPL